LQVRGGLLSYNKSLIDDLSTNLEEVCSVCGKVFFFGNASVARPNVGEFTDRLRDTLAELSPVGQRLPRPQEELVARYCVVLALYETIYRSGHIPDSLRFPSTASPLTAAAVDDLLAIPQSNWIDDLCNLSWAFHDDNGDFLQRTATLNPTFDGSAHVGGADADIIVDDCLIEFKLTVNSGLKKLRDWLYQLLGYTLLDYGDKYGIRSVALYLPRQRTWLRWDLNDLIDKLGGSQPLLLGGSRDQLGAALGNLRAEFRRVVEPSPARVQTRAKRSGQ